MSHPPLVAVVGPTAAGKTALSIDLAAALAGEIVCADSRQIYRGMDIGTAKATPAERRRVPHHLIDIVEPDRVLTAAEYQPQAYAAIADVQARGRLPLLVGGSGQYVLSVLDGWRIPAVPPQPALRAELEAQAEAEGAAALHARLAGCDPAAAAAIDYRNVRRVVRALEVCLVTGRPISEQQRKEPPPFRIFRLGVTRERAELYARIDARVDAMLDGGLVEEVRALAAAGYAWDLPAMTSLGYRQIGDYLRGAISLGEAVALIKKLTRRFVHQQFTWFRTDDPAIHWVNPGRVSFADVLADVATWLRAGDD